MPALRPIAHAGVPRVSARSLRPRAQPKARRIRAVRVRVLRLQVERQCEGAGPSTRVSPDVSAAVSDIVEAWKWRDPEEIIEALLRESGRREGKAAAVAPIAAVERVRPTVREGCVKRDRYYTLARRIHVKRLMKGKG